MDLCFDATRFGFGLDEAIAFASEHGLNAIEFAFEPFTATAKSANLTDDEARYLAGVRELSQAKGIKVACLRLNFELDAADKKAVKHFHLMMKKLANVSEAVGCRLVSFMLAPGKSDLDVDVAAEAINPVLRQLEKKDRKLLLSLSTAQGNRGRTLKQWRPLEPQEWRNLLAHCEGLGLSFSAADCAWQNINYLQVLPGLVSAIEHVEANDVEINRELLQDSGLFGPLWWRYRRPGKGHIDWRQLVEALKMYDFQGSLSIRLDDEFLDGDNGALEETLDESVKFFQPMLKY